MIKQTAKKVSLMVACSLFMVMGTQVAPADAANTLHTPKSSPKAKGAINWKALNLSPNQVKNINLLRLNFNQVAIKLKADIKIKKIEIEKQLLAPAANPKRLNKLLQEQLTLESKLQKASLQNFLAIKKILTPKQLMMLPKARVLR